MADRTSTSDATQAGASPAAGATNWFSESGFMDKARNLKDGAVGAAKSGWEKSKEVYNDAKNSDAAKQAMDKGKEVLDSPTTKKIAGDVVQQGKRIGNEKMHEATGAYQAGKRGDVDGVIRNGLPLVTDVANLHGTALKIAKDTAFEVLISNAPPERRGDLIRAKQAFDLTDKITNPNIAGMIEGQMKRQLKEQAINAARDPNTRQEVVETGKEAASKTGTFFRGIGEKLHIVQPREQAEQQRRQ